MTQALLVLALLAAGCAHLPRQESDAAARDRFLSVYAAPHGATRGAGSLTMHRGKEGGGARARWGSTAEGLAVAGYVGPARVLDSSLRGDSLFLVLRRAGMGVAGALSGEGDIDGRVLRFAATPWDFSPEWVRAALERAEVRATRDGWAFEGVLNEGAMRGGSHRPYYRFSLELSARGEPRVLSIGQDGAAKDLIRVRYGPERRYNAGRIPSWIEWSFSGSVVVLRVEDLAAADPAKIRYAPSIEPDWTIFPLDEPAGQRLIRWLLGLSEGGNER